MKEELVFPVYEFRPIETDRQLLRYNDGNWIEDDGEWDICFITNDMVGAQFCYYVSLPYRENQLWSWARDGQWGGYVSDHPNGNAWHYMSKDGERTIGGSWRRDNHPNIKAHDIGMSKLYRKHGASNGRGVKFHIGDPYIIAGLLREKESKKIITFPEQFKCIYCGKHDLSKIEMGKQRC